MEPGIKLASKRTNRIVLESIQSIFVNNKRYISAVVFTDLGHRCGYIGYPKTNNIEATNDYTLSDYYLSVHGGVTYNDNAPPFLNSREIKKFNLENYYWLGYDCAHSGDSPDEKYLQKYFKKQSWESELFKKKFSSFKTLDFC